MLDRFVEWLEDDLALKVSGDYETEVTVTYDSLKYASVMIRVDNHIVYVDFTKKENNEFATRIFSSFETGMKTFHYREKAWCIDCTTSEIINLIRRHCKGNYDD